MKKIILSFSLIFILVISSCKNKSAKPHPDRITTTEKDIENRDKISDLKTEDDQLFLITKNSFMGFKIGDTINSTSNNLKTEIQKNGEGAFPGYALLDTNGKKIGFVFPKFNTDNIIGSIEINSPDYQTKEGIAVGSTYKDLKSKYPNLETHGSEVESRTSSQVDGLSFLLDIYFNTYQIDESTIKPSTKIMKISILGSY